MTEFETEFDYGELVDVVTDLLDEREGVSVLDPNMNIWDGFKEGDRTRILCMDTGQAILVGAPWESPEDLKRDREEEEGEGPPLG